MRKNLAILLVCFSLFVVGCSSDNNSETKEDASNFPEKPIEMIIPYDPGGATDRTARILADSVSNFLPNNESVVVENKAGGGSTVGLTSLFNADNDGYTIGLTMQTGVSVKPHTENLGYDWDSFTEVMTLVQSPQLLVVAADAPWNDFDEWLDYVKENPGEFKYGHAGIGSIGQLAMEELANEEGLELTGIPYEGGGSSRQALLSGETDGDIGSQADIDPEQNKVLVNLGKEIPGVDATTLEDNGIDVGVIPWIGLIAPPEMDEERTQIIHDAFKEAIEDQDTIDKLEELYIAPYYNGPEDFQDIIKERYDISGEILNNLDI